MTGSRRKIPFINRLQAAFPDTDKEELYAAILCGEAKSGDETVREPRRMIDPETVVTLERRRFVSRGGDKLDGVLDALAVDPAGRVCLDAGASTGGFTDCLLSRGARVVHAVDVGYNQLAWKIRTDRRVLVWERTNVMDLAHGDLTPPPSMAVADLSFRSLRGAASQLIRLTDRGIVLVLAKPQFEHPRGETFRGVVNDPDERVRTIESLVRDLEREGAFVVDAAASPILGRKGNHELFLRLSAEPATGAAVRERVLSAALQKSL